MENAAARYGFARWAAFAAVALLGLAVRLPQLDARPMHTDEAVNAYIVGQLLAGEAFHYDSQDRHGPALAAVAFPLARMERAKSFSDLTESKLRLTSVLAGTITILLFGAAAEMFGLLPSLLAALLFAVAPLPVYYDRYFIHESLFCAATFGLILSGWRTAKTSRVGYGALAGACAACMTACKETAILSIVAMAGAGLLFSLLNLRGKSAVKLFRPEPLLAGGATFVVLSGVLFTWFGRDGTALTALIRAIPNLLARTGGQGHQKPFWYYGWLLSRGWSGALLVALAILGLLIVLKKRDSSPYHWLAYYGFFIAAIYSLIPYKTPWLTLNLWLPLSLLAATAVEFLGRQVANKLHRRAATTVLGIVGAVAGLLIAQDTRERVFLHPADEGNPYAYAQTSDDILGLPAEITELARQRGISTPRIAVIAADPWPLPWYLRHFPQVGFWLPGQQLADADFYVTSTKAAEQYAGGLAKFRPEFFGVRPGVLVLLWSLAQK